MRQLLKRGTEWDRTTDRKADFSKIKHEPTNLPCLAHYNRNIENIVTTDACKTGLTGLTNELKQIGFVSRYLKEAEKKCSNGKLELLAVG